MKIVDAQNSFLKRNSKNKNWCGALTNHTHLLPIARIFCTSLVTGSSLFLFFIFHTIVVCMLCMFVKYRFFFSFHIFHLNDYYYYLWKKDNHQKEERELYWIWCFESIIDRVPDSFNNPKRITYMFVSYTLIMWEAFLCDSFEPNKQKKKQKNFPNLHSKSIIIIIATKSTTFLQFQFSKNKILVMFLN